MPDNTPARDVTVWLAVPTDDGMVSEGYSVAVHPAASLRAVTDAAHVVLDPKTPNGKEN